MVSSNTTNPAKLLQEIYEITRHPRTEKNKKKNGAQDSNSSQNRSFKVDVKEKRVRLPPGCGETIFKLCKALGHRSAGQTVEWLLDQAKAPVEAALGPTATKTNSSQPLPPPAPTVVHPLPPPSPAVVHPHSNDPLLLLPPLPPPSPAVVDPHSNDLLLLLTPPPPPAPAVVDPLPNDPFSPAPATIVPTPIELPSAPAVVAGDNNNARMPAPFVMPKPVSASGIFRHNRAGDEVEITADAVAMFLYGPMPRA